MQGPGNRCCRQCQDIHRAFQPLQLLFVFDAKALLLIQNQKPQIVECDVLLRADHNIDLTRFEIFDDGTLHTRGTEAT